MKKKNPPYAIIGAVLLGIVCVFLAIHWKSGQDAAQQAKLDAMKADFEKQFTDLQAQKAQVIVPQNPDMRNVYYATQPIEAGVKISPAFFEKKLTPNNILPDAFGEGSDIIGYYAVRPIEKGDPLTPHNIDRSLPYLSIRIPPGMRALALPVFNSDMNDTGGFVVDGDKVDLLFTTTAPGDPTQPFTVQSALQDITVLYVPGPTTRSDMTVGVTATPAPGQPLSVTFLVTPEQAQALIFLSQTRMGKFSMVLRGRNDKDEARIKPFTADSLSSIDKLNRMSNHSLARVEELQKQVDEEEQKEKAQAAQGNTNETPRPTPPGQ